MKGGERARTLDEALKRWSSSTVKRCRPFNRIYLLARADMVVKVYSLCTQMLFDGVILVQICQNFPIELKLPSLVYYSFAHYY